MNKSKEIFLEKLLGKELIIKAENKGLDKWTLLNLWHCLEKTPEEFKEIIKNVLESDDFKTVSGNADQLIDNLEKHISNVDSMRQGSFHNMVMDLSGQKK